MGVIGTITTLAEQLGDAVWSVASGMIGFAVSLLANLIITLSAALPDDPVNLPAVVSSWERGLSWLNWFVPVGQFAAIMATYLAATVAYYSFQYITEHYLYKG